MLTMDYYLLRKGNHTNPLRINLDKNEVLIGRKFFPEMNDSIYVSRQHASFKISSDSEWFVTDLKSVNGVYVNGIRIARPLHRLRLGDVIGLGVISEACNQHFVFLLCRVNVKEEPDDKDDDVILLSDDETSDTSNCKANQSLRLQKNGVIDNLPVDDVQVKKKTEDSNSWKNLYSHILNGPQPFILLKRCDKLLRCQKKVPSLKRTKPITSDSSSDDEASNTLRKKKCKSDQKIDTLCNVYSSDEEPDLMFRSKHLLKDSSFEKQRHNVKQASFEKQRHNVKDTSINTPIHKFSNKEMDCESQCSSSSDDSSSSSDDSELPSLTGLIKGTSSKNTRLHLENTDSERNNFKEQIKPSAPCSEEIKKNCSFSCKGGNSAIEQPSVSHKIKIENDLENSETNAQIPVFNSTAIKIKTEVSAAGVKVEEVNQEEDNSEDEAFGYSQMDEIIVISDDDDYLSFPASQEKNAESVLNIKVEPADYDDNTDFDKWIKKNIEKPVLKCNLDAESEDEQCSENVDAIRDFVQGNNISKENLPTSSANSENHLEIEEERTDKTESNVNDFFPILSQNFFSQENLHPDKFQQNSSEHDFLACKGKLKTDSSKTIGKKHSSVLFIEPQPMKYRPRYQRGREEWFDDGGHEKSGKGCNWKEVKQSSETPKNVKETRVQPKSKINSKKSVKKKKSIKETVKERMGHRIRVPNGGSAIPMTSTELKISNKTKLVRPTDPPVEKQTPVRSKESSTKRPHVTKNKIALENVSKEHDRLRSRTQLLKKNPIEKKPIPKSSEKEKGYKIPKVKSTSTCFSSNKNKEAVQMPQSKSKKWGQLDTVHEQNFPQVSATASKVIKQAEKHQSNKPSNTVSLLPNITAPTACARKKDVASTQSICIKETNHKTSEPVKQSYRVTNNVQTRDPRLRNNQNKMASIVPVIQQPTCVVKPNNGQEHSLPPNAKQVFKKLVKLDFDSVLEVILHWKPAWLKEYKHVGKPPPCITKDLKTLPSSFRSSDEYITSFYPIILLELWEYIFKEYDQIENAAKDKHGINAICVMVTECISKGDLMVLNCESLVNANPAFYPREGNLVIVDLKEANNKQDIAYKVFGYIFNHRVEKLDSRRLHREFYRRPEAKSTNSLLYKFSLKTKKLRFQLALEKLTKAYVLCYVANKVRLAEGLQYLITSPLKHDILKPSEKTVTCRSRNTQLPEAVVGCYNQMQTSAIVNIAEEMRAERFKHKLILLQGPPGTGKTHTITGLIQNLIVDKDVKVLITAPSNAAIDEIGRRLIQLKKSHPQKNLRIVRVGLHKQIHRDLVPYSLENLTAQHANRNTRCELEKVKKSLHEKEELIQRLNREINFKRQTETLAKEVGVLNSKLLMESRRKQTLIEEMERLKKKEKDPATYDSNVYPCKLIVLEKANIILSTLGSCRLKILEKVFGEQSNTRFTCCIVDEAAQCTEPEIMQLLVFGLSKFVLMGDHQQLPATVYSKIAVKLNYNVSFFERIHIHFQKQHLPSPILMLTEQYRMHSKICAFPSSRFYLNRLCTPSYLDRKFNSFPLKPLVIFNVQDSQESNIQCSKKNFSEAEIIFYTCEELCRMPDFKKYSIGIITPYQGQKNLVLSNFNGDPRYNKIEVNTVDSFQGREKDIIILSCVRARSHNGNIGFLECKKRLNVAITRARQCLIICGHMNSLYNHPDWRALIDHSKLRQVYVTVTSSEDIPFVIKEIRKQ